MKLATPVIIVTGCILAGACTTPAEHRFENQRTVFNNPYAPPEIDQTGIGPDCDEQVLRDGRCGLDSLIYPGRGRFARDRNGNLVRLTRNERRFLRERREAIQSRIDVLESLENGTPIPPNSPALDNILPPPPPPPAPKVGDTVPSGSGQPR